MFPNATQTVVDLRKADAASAGAKAAHLARLMAAGMRVPDGFVITTGAYRQASGSIPGDLAQAIREALRRLGEDAPVAVRSSATAEDLPGASFAGQHDTFLNVTGFEALLDAVRRCWASLHSDRAVRYREKNAIPDSAVAMGVIVQAMVAADAAGVIFTADPVSGQAGRITIEAVPGLGEELVSGRMAPDRIVLAGGKLEVIERQSARAGMCIDDAMAQELGRLAQRVEEVFGCPQDIEFAVRGREVFLLQARPITVRPTEGGDIWSNANTGELLPEPVTPMTWSILDTGLRLLLHPVLAAVGVNVSDRPWFGRIAGRMYMNVTVTRDLLTTLPFPGGLDVDEVFGGYLAHTPQAAPPARRWRPRLRLLINLPLLGLMAIVHSGERSARLLLAQLARRADEAVATDFESMPDEDLARYVPRMIQDIRRNAATEGWGPAIVGVLGFGMGGVMALFRLTQRWLGDEHGAIANRLLSGAGGMASAESGMDLWRLAEWARARPAVAETILAGGAWSELRERLRSSADGDEFLARWDEFMGRHGHHARGEIDISLPRWHETPDEVLIALRGYLRMGPEADPVRLQRQHLRDRGALVAECRRRLRNPLKWWAIQVVTRKGQSGVVARENIKNQAVRLIAAVRRGLLEMGRRLAARGIVDAPEDVFFFSFGELPPVAAGRAKADVRAMIAQRRAEHERNKALTPPPVIVGEYDPARDAPAALDPSATVLKGLAVSAGRVVGRARVILHSGGDQRIMPGEILVAPFTDPGWTTYFLPAAGIVVDLGGQLSHGSIIAREYGIPAVVNVGPATRLIRTGQLIEVDGDRGVVRILDEGGDSMLSSAACESR